MKLLIPSIAAAFVYALSASAFAGVGEDQIATNKCNKCHTATTTKKGPSFASIATKYKTNADARNKVFLQLKNGGKVGDEDDHKKVEASDADIKAMVEVVLTAK